MNMAQLFSGCQDDQCSSDGDVERFKIGGAMTNAFIRAYKAQPFQPYPEFLEQVRQKSPEKAKSNKIPRKEPC